MLTLIFLLWAMLATLVALFFLGVLWIVSLDHASPTPDQVDEPAADAQFVNRIS